MNIKKIKPITTLYFITIVTLLLLNSCSPLNKKQSTNNPIKEATKATYPSDVIPFFQHWNLILGDGSNAGQATNFENKDFFYATNDGKRDWAVFKTPNAGNTHGTSNNCRTELAQLKKWSPMKDAKLNATLKVLNVANTGDARVAATYSVVIGQIHSADGHENEPLKIFYKKFPGHIKGSVFWNYEINTAGDDNSGRWDYSYPVWGYDFSDVGMETNTYPPEPKDGIALGEEFSYAVEIKEGMMHLKFISEGHETKTFTKNLIKSEYAELSDRPEQVENLFVPIGQDGVERKNAYADEGLFFKLGSYNQTNGKDPKVNKVWCSGAETHGGDIQKQYADGNYAEVWFKSANIEIPDDAISNAGYFTANDDLSKKTVYPSTVIPFMDKFKMLMGDGTSVDDLIDFEDPNFFYTVIDGTRRWVVYKTPNSGVTSPNSSNTRTELHEKREWTPEEGGKLTATCRVMQVSTSGDARVAASYSTVVGQIHSGDGHENEPLKIFYKKFPGQSKGSVFWNYEINTEGDNSKRWDYSYPVWGYDFSDVGTSKDDFPTEPEDGIELGEEFSYEVNVYEGIMHLTFKSDGHETKTFTKNLIASEYVNRSDIPAQVMKIFAPIGQDGTEQATAYKGELNYFKQGAYNQTNGKDPEKNMVWCAGAETYGGDIAKQYENDCYTEVWFRDCTVGKGTPPEQKWETVNIEDGQGHGPDLDTDEGIRAMTYNFIRNDKTYQQESYGVYITEIKKVKSNPDIFETTFIHRRLGDDEVCRTGRVEVKGNQARWVAGSNETIGIEQVLEMIFRKALDSGDGGAQVEIKADSKISDLLNTEEQLRTTRYIIQRIFQPDMEKMDSLWNKLSPEKTFSEWLEILKTT